MSNAEKSLNAGTGKIYTILFILMLFIQLTYSQNQFRLGFTGMYPSYYDYTNQTNINWNNYHEMNTNLWQGWWIGNNWDHFANGTNSTIQVLQNLNSENIDGYFQPDTIRWAALGRVQINYAANGRDDRFIFNSVSTIAQTIQNDPFNGGKATLYFNKIYGQQFPNTLVLYNVKENQMQSKNNNFDPMNQVDFPYNDYRQRNPPVTSFKHLNNYYIMPKIRINNYDAYGPNTEVVRVIAKKFNGYIDVADTLTIYTSDFLDGNGEYDGSYLEYFGNGHNVKIRADILNDGRGTGACHVDYEIFWYGTVSFWIDYVKVMDEAAYRLLSPDPVVNNVVRNAIRDKVNNIYYHDAGSHMKGFYLEEIDYSNLACIAFLNKTFLPSIPPDHQDNYKVIPLLNVVDSYTAYINNDPGAWQFYFDLFDSLNAKTFMTVRYPFVGSVTDPNGKLKLPDNLNLHPLSFPSYYTDDIKADIQKCYNNGISQVSNVDYNTDLQSRFDTYEGYLKYVFNPACQSPRNLVMYCVPQIIFWHFHNQDGWMKEPMTSEIGSQIGIALCNGAKGILPYAYESWHSTLPQGSEFYNKRSYLDGDGLSTGFHYDLSLGASDFDNTHTWGYGKRELDVYGVNKWDFLKALYAKINAWGPVLANSTSAEGFSTSRDGAAHYYINDIQSIYRDINLNYTPTNDDAVKYWEEGFFNNSSQTKYLMMVNRRSVPEYPANSGNGDLRQLKIKFNPAFLPGYTNWKITEVGSMTPLITIDKNSGLYYDFGEYQPGEFKFYQIAPASLTGGTLVADENISGESFTCLDTVWNNGHNITISGNSTISFSDSATIIMNGGTFQVGSSSNGPGTQYNTFQGANGHKWNGLQFNGTNVKIYNAKFQDINGTVAGGNYAVTCIDCPLNDIRYSNFVMGNDTAGAVNIAYTSSNESAAYSYVKYNTFSMNGSYGRAIQIQGFAGSSAGTYIENNTLNSDGNAIGMFLSTVSSGEIRNNIISNFIIGINTSLSTLDLYGNNISNSTSVSDGIKGVSSSNLNLGSNSGEYLGGFNNITSSSGASNDIEVNNSNFNTDKGANTFDVLSSGYHYYGSFYGSSFTTQATKNCYKIAGTLIADTSLPINHVINSRSNLISYTFPTYNCSATPPSWQTIVDIGNGMYDTIPTSIGLGGSYSSVPTPKQLYDSLHILMMFKNYSGVKNLCYSLINTFPDSTESSEALQTLYMASVSSDTTQSSFNTLKSYYEGLILNHPDNTAMVTISNYLVLKCRVLLKQYSQALSGFQQIINNNPYSYDGLMARWDYMATSLLMNGGSGGELLDDNVSQRHAFDPQDIGSDEFDKSDESDQFGNDKSPYTKEQRANIRQSVITTLDDNRKTDEQKIDILTQKAKNGDISAQKELKQKINLKSVIKTERPKNIAEHMKMVNADIQKVFGSKENYSSKNQNNVPTSFNLYQNYPNPFNPSTTIKFALPNDVKVVIKIYDILGREVRTLVNEIRKAGYYEEKFDGSNLASGVYFYRIEARQAGSSTGAYVNSKKMVLVK